MAHPISPTMLARIMRDSRAAGNPRMEARERILAGYRKSGRRTFAAKLAALNLGEFQIYLLALFGRQAREK